jgi:hypothetical protein
MERFLQLGNSDGGLTGYQKEENDRREGLKLKD